MSTETTHNWNAPDALPDVQPNADRFFQIAVRRKGRDKVVSFPAVYCNSLALSVDYDPHESSGNRWSSHFLPEELADEGELGFTGWWDIKSDSEYDTRYMPALEEGDELVRWCELPQWDAIAAQQAAEPVEQSDNCGCSGEIHYSCKPKPEQAVGDGVDDHVAVVVDLRSDNYGHHHRIKWVNHYENAFPAGTKLYTTPRPAVATPVEVTELHGKLRTFLERERSIAAILQTMVDAGIAAYKRETRCEMSHGLMRVLLSESLAAHPHTGYSAVLDGWKLVPVEPTKEMLDAVCSSDGYEPWTDGTMTETYKAMLAAAPEVPRA